MPWRTLEPMKNRLFNRSSVLQVLDDNSLQQLRRDVGVPDSFRVHHDDRAIAAHAEARSFTSLYAIRSEQKIFALQQLGESRIQFATTSVWRAEVAGADKNVVGVTLHLRLV